MGGSYYSFLCSILSTGKDCKTPQQYLDVPTTSRRIFLRSWTRFKDLLQKVPHHGIDLWLQVQIFYDHVTPVTRRTINQSAGYCMKNPEQAFVEYASSRTDEAGVNQISRDWCPTSWHRLSKFEADFKQQQSEMTNKIDTVLKAITDQMAGALLSDTVKNLKLNVNTTTSVLSARSYPTEDSQCSTHIHRDDGDVMFIEIVKKNDDSRKEEPEAGGLEVEYFDIFLTWGELAYHKYCMCGPIPSIFLRNPIIMEGCPSNLKIPCNIGHEHVEKAYIDLNSPLNVMTRMLYNWIMRRKLNLREDTNRGVSNFTGRIKGMYVFIGNFTYVLDFMIVEDISAIIDPMLS
ncbi:hypothetical protein Tco_0843423 [Tanacetum coccineum]|uniref:MAK10-like protein n=1 Tax=Tanacetum coccineum TaxID=301880 RepID=A0ABQ5B246_9ASTR